MLSELATSVRFNGKLNLSSGSSGTKSNIIAVGLVDKNFIPNIGQLLPSGIVIAGSTNVTTSNIAEVIRRSCLMGKGVFFTQNMVNGTRKAVATKADTKFGPQVVEEELNEEDVTFDFVYSGATKDANGLRRMRGISTRDAFLFTNNTLEIVRADNDALQIGGVDIPIDGDSTKFTKGMFSLYAHLMPDSTGEYAFYYNVKGDLATPLNYTITRGTLTAATESVCNGAFRRYVITATQATIAFSTGVTEGCQTWSLYQVVNGTYVPVTGANLGSINVTTGLVTLPTTHVAGVTQYVAMVENSSGVWGEFKFEIEK